MRMRMCERMLPFTFREGTVLLAIPTGSAVSKVAARNGCAEWHQPTLL